MYSSCLADIPRNMFPETIRTCQDLFSKVFVYSKTLNNRRGALITSRGVVLVMVFVVLGVVLVEIEVVASHYCY